MQIARNIAKGQLVPLTFHQNQVAADQTDAQLVTIETDDASSVSTTLTDGYPMPFDGEVVAVSFLLDSAGSAGSLTVGATIGGTEDADTTLSITTAASGSLKVSRGLAKFVAGDVLGSEITTDASWNGTASDLVVVIWVILALEGI